MADLKDDATKSGSQPVYSPPRVVRIGDLNGGEGMCTDGSSDAVAGCATGNTPGSFACAAGPSAVWCSSGSGYH